VGEFDSLRTPGRAGGIYQRRQIVHRGPVEPRVVVVGVERLLAHLVDRGERPNVVSVLVALELVDHHDVRKVEFVLDGEHPLHEVLVLDDHPRRTGVPE